MQMLQTLRSWWRELKRPADRRDDYRQAQQALVRAGMSPEASQEELDIYLEEIRAARTPTFDLLKSGFLAGMGVVLAALALFIFIIVATGVVELLIDPEGKGSRAVAEEQIPREREGPPVGTPGDVLIAAGLAIATVFGVMGAGLALLERARFERQRAPYSFAHRRRTRRVNAQVEVLLWVAMLAPLLLALTPYLRESSAVPVLFLLALGLLLFRSLWRSTFPEILKSLSPYNAAGLASQVLTTEAVIIERQEEAFYGKGVWRRWHRYFSRRVNW
jgi:Na+-transporting methylmalonyl-CoA/oxaloacetate decarboxylase gamma subunit